MENVTFILGGLDHMSPEESRHFKDIPGSVGAQNYKRLRAVLGLIATGQFFPLCALRPMAPLSQSHFFLITIT